MTNVHTLTSVSYTHLDVYKRQVWTFVIKLLPFYLISQDIKIPTVELESMSVMCVIKPLVSHLFCHVINKSTLELKNIRVTFVIKPLGGHLICYNKHIHSEGKKYECDVCQTIHLSLIHIQMCIRDRCYTKHT